ncbi:2217_t:CDS:2, partial [Dentiscutata heterogama]
EGGGDRIFEDVEGVDRIFKDIESVGRTIENIEKESEAETSTKAIFKHLLFLLKHAG